MKIGFIGLGTMGGPIALNAIRGGGSLVVHDVRRAAATPHLEMGAEWADTPREVALGSDVVFTSLPGPVEVEAVALGEDGLHEGLTAGNVYLNLSASSPDLIRDIHARLSPSGVHVLDAPVSGGTEGARTGNWYLRGVGGQPYFGREGITWPLVAARFNARCMPPGYILDSGSPCAFARDGVERVEIFFVLGWTLTELASRVLKTAINHTRNIRYPFYALSLAQTVPERRHRKRSDRHVQPLAVPVSPTNQSVQPRPQLRMQPLVSVHLAPLPLHVASGRRMAVRL